MDYVGQIWRPPSEAKSFILQITVGCSHNKCTFCSMYKDKDFYVKSEEKIKSEIERAAEYYTDLKRIFLADGDALVLKTDKLLSILDLLYTKFPGLERVTSYANPGDIIRKPLADLKKLKKAGLEMIYMGMESGSAKILKDIKKGATPEMMIEAASQLKKAGIKKSVTIILGLGGKEESDKHARETARVLSQMEPEYLAALTLIIKPKTELAQKVEKGELTELSPKEILKELYQIIDRIQIEDECVFRSNHASNYTALKGTLPEDKESLLQQIEDSITTTPETMPSGLRRL